MRSATVLAVPMSCVTTIAVVPVRCCSSRISRLIDMAISGSRPAVGSS